MDPEYHQLSTQMNPDCHKMSTKLDSDLHPWICSGWPSWLLRRFLGRNTSSLVTISTFLIILQQTATLKQSLGWGLHRPHLPFLFPERFLKVHSESDMSHINSIFEGLLRAGRVITNASFCANRHARQSLVQLGRAENLQRLHWRGFGQSRPWTSQRHNPWL